MSLDCRILKKFGTNEIYYYCRNTGVIPHEVAFWTDPAETPKEIEHYFKNLGTITIGPCMADIFGIQEKLYPNFSKCNHPKFKNTDCLAECCKFAPGKNWEKCLYFPKKKESLKGILTHENSRS